MSAREHFVFGLDGNMTAEPECWCGEVHIGPLCSCGHDELAHLPDLRRSTLGRCGRCACAHYGSENPL